MPKCTGLTDPNEPVRCASVSQPIQRLGLVDAKRIQQEYERDAKRCGDPKKPFSDRVRAAQRAEVTVAPSERLAAYRATSDAIADEVKDCLKQAGADSAARRLAAQREVTGGTTVHVGSDQKDIIAAYGYPEKMNTTETAGALRVQYVYPNGMYIYTVNGRVTAIQN